MRASAASCSASFIRSVSQCRLGSTCRMRLLPVEIQIVVVRKLAEQLLPGFRDVVGMLEQAVGVSRPYAPRTR
jgi:hypothetical protein